MLGGILIDTCEIEGNVDYSSWVRFPNSGMGDGIADEQVRSHYWIICCGRLGLGKDVQAIAISNVSYSYIGQADDSAFAICAAMFQNRYVVYGLNTIADQ
jgi:hypothetical protein